MKILSIDVGLKNLSYCYFNDVKIIDWQNVSVIEGNCNKIKIDEITEKVLIKLNETFNDSFVADIVLIENQPMLKNGLMKTVAVVIYTYFNMMRLQYGNIDSVQFISAGNKLKCKKAIEEGYKKETYKDRKKASIDLTKLYIKDCFPERLEWFNNLKKSDDVSDSFLQAIYYMEKQLKLLY